MTDGIADLVTDRMSEGYVLIDGEGTVLAANGAARSLLGMGVLVGTDVGALPTGVRDLVADDGGAPNPVELSVDGASRFVQVEVTSLDRDGAVDRLVLLRDVTARVSLDRYRRIVEAMGDGVYVLDAAGRYVTVNDHVLELTGYDRADLVGSEAAVAYDEADRETFERAIRALLAAAAPGVRTVEADLHTADGAVVPIEVTLTLLTGEDGAFRGTVGVVRDVTGRRERQQELERYETLLEIMPDTVVVTDTDGTIVDLHGFDGWSGYDPDELVGEHLSKTTPREDVELAEALIRELFADDDRSKVTFEMAVVTKAGERVPHENHLALLPPDEDGMVPGSMSVLRNIAERKARERALESLNTATRDLVAAESRESVVDEAVETARAVLGLPLSGVWLYDETADALVPASYPDDEALPVDPPVFRPGESLAWEVYEAGESRVYDDLAAAERVHNPETTIRSEVLVPLGDHGVLVSGSTEPAAFDEDQRNLAGVLGAAVGTALDRLDREREREAQRLELRRKNERLEEFTSVVSHDLRNPLTVAQARVQQAIETGATADLGSAADALDRMDRLIEDLLTLARQGESVGERERLLLSDAARVAWATTEAPDARLAIEDDATLLADRSRLVELLGNLFRNAVEHAGPAVAVRVGALPDGFFVADDGPGIPEDEREHVFEHGVSGSADGTGFGLAIVEEVAEAHGWTVELEEGRDGGARFVFGGVDSSTSC